MLVILAAIGKHSVLKKGLSGNVLRTALKYSWKKNQNFNHLISNALILTYKIVHRSPNKTVLFSGRTKNHRFNTVADVQSMRIDRFIFLLDLFLMLDTSIRLEKEKGLYQQMLM
jgi:hypothetical protein